MTPKQARRSSINHWKRMMKLSLSDIKNGKEAPTEDNCALCSLYFFDDCVDCPVFKKTGKGLCNGTPYHEAWKAYEAIENKGGADLDAFRAAVQDEINFLESLEVA